MNENELTIFTNEEFGNVRTIMIEGKPYFCASDVAKALGYKRPNDAVSQHCRATVKHSTPISGKMQEINFIPEGDIYRLIIRSKLPSAEKFENWVMDEVLPQLRQTGSYSMTKQDSYMIEDPIERAKRWIEEQEEKKKLEVMNAAKDQVICELQPKADFANDILLSPGTVTITQIAKDYGMRGAEMNNLLHKLRIQYKVNGQWVLYAKYDDKGYTKSCTKKIKNTYGKSESIVYTRWTEEGRKFLNELLKNEGIYPIKKAQMNK